jgi:N-acetylneuraminate synthase
MLSSCWCTLNKVTTIGEIGINHNGSIETAKRLIDVCASAGLDYVKFQKRTPELCVPEHQKNIIRDTPWGQMTYLQYKNKIEFGPKEYNQIDRHCRQKGIKWTASAWDIPSLEFLADGRVPFVKIPSACVTDSELMDAAAGYPMVVSTGMCDDETVDYIVDNYGKNILCLMHCVSTYPSRAEDQNLSAITWMKNRYPELTIGFSNHFPGLTFIPAAVALGALWVEFHVTLDRSSWGTDQSSSIEPEGIFKVMKWLRSLEVGMGDGVKKILESEVPIMQKLRRIV